MSRLQIHSSQMNCLLGPSLIQIGSRAKRRRHPMRLSVHDFRTGDLPENADDSRIALDDADHEVATILGGAVAASLVGRGPRYLLGKGWGHGCLALM